MKKREPVRIFRNRQCRFVHQLADGEVRQQKTIELLPHQFRGLAAQYDLTPPEMGLQFVKRVFYLPPLVIERGQFFGRRPERSMDGSHQPVDRFGVGYALELIVNDTNSYAFRFVPRILLGRIDGAEIRAIAQSLVYLKSQVLAHSPEQVATASLGFGPQRETEEKAIRQTQHPGLQLGNHLLGQRDLAGGVASSRLISRQVRYRAPRVLSEAIGTTTCSYSRRKGSAPRRERASLCRTLALPVEAKIESIFSRGIA